MENNTEKTSGEQTGELTLRLYEQEQTIARLLAQLRASFVEMMLYGKRPPPAEPGLSGRDTDGFAVFFETPCFIVAALEPEDRSELFGSDGQPLIDGDDMLMVKGMIFSVIETMLGPHCIAYCCESDLAFCNVLINLSDAENHPMSRLRARVSKALDEALEMIRKNYGIRLVAGLSPTVRSYEMLPEARMESYNALRKAFPGENVANTRRVVAHVERLRDEAMAASPAQGRQRDERAKTRLMTRLEKNYFQCTVNHDFQGARAALLEIVSADLDVHGVRLEAEKIRVLNHMESVLNILGLSSYVFPVFEGEAEGGDICMRDVGSREELIRQIDDFFDMINRRTRQREPSPNDRMDQIVAYISENYADCNMSLGLLCDKFRINQSYLSRSFKQLVGVGVLEFIQRRRIARAKELLMEPYNSIDSIWSRVGYTNRRTFDRTFKRFEGMTASAYRNRPEAK